MHAPFFEFAEGGSVFDAVAKSPELGRFFVDLRARAGLAARRAQVAVCDLHGARVGGESSLIDCRNALVWERRWW